MSPTSRTGGSGLSSAPGILVGALWTPGPHQSSRAELRDALSSELSAFAQVHELSAVADLEPVRALRELIRSSGRDPSRHRSSLEKILRAAITGRAPAFPLAAVGAATLATVRLRAVVAVHCAEAVVGRLSIRRGGEKESVIAIGKRQVEVSRMPLVCDGAGPITGVTFDSERTKVTSDDDHLLWLLLWPTCLPAGAFADCQRQLERDLTCWGFGRVAHTESLSSALG